MSLSPARAAAFEVLTRVERTSAYASELLHSSRFDRLSRRDHHLLTELVMGVLRWRGSLDDLLRSRVGQNLEKLDLEVATALRLGAYQLVSLDRVPARAAIYESVEMVKRARKRSAAGMVNAILRKLSAEPGVLDNHSGHPAWLVERWANIYGADQTRQICDYDQRPPQIAIRPLGTGVARELEQEGIQLRAGQLLQAACIVESGDITRTRAFGEHRVAIQDEASQLVARLVGRGRAILDACAAPGGKTTILREQNPDATIVAMEFYFARARLLRKLLSGKNIAVLAADARTMPLRASFDRILIDAPCSGTGTLARNPEIKWRLKMEDILRLAKYQVEIVSSTLPQVSSGGRIIYSTCSLEPEENEQVVETILLANPSFHRLSCAQELEALGRRQELVWKNLDSLSHGPYLRTLPGVEPCDGFFAAILQRE